MDEVKSMCKVPEMFGALVFNDDIMRARLPKEIYKSLKKTREDGLPLEIHVANSVANAMKNWALEHGATHYTHWFQPMTGITAEKHDSFMYTNRILLLWRRSFRQKNTIAAFNGCY